MRSPHLAHLTDPEATAPANSERKRLCRPEYPTRRTNRLASVFIRREKRLNAGARGCPLKRDFSTDLEHRAAAADEDAPLRELGPAAALEFVEVFPGRRPRGGVSSARRIRALRREQPCSADR